MEVDTEQVVTFKFANRDPLPGKPAAEPVAPVEEAKPEMPASVSTTERDLCLDATNMVNKIFQADSDWLKRMCEQEVKQREINEV